MSTSPDKAPAGNTGTANMRWQFIDSSNNSRSNLTQVKRHVMQEYMRQKKSGSGHSESEEDTRPRKSKRGRPRKARNTKRKSSAADASESSATERRPASTEDAGADVEEIDRDSFSDPLALPEPIQTAHGFLILHHDHLDGQVSQGQNSDLNRFGSWSSLPKLPIDPSRSPRTILSAARTDPFNSLPLELDLEEQQLFDFYVNDMPACSYGSHFRTPKAHDWYTAVFVPEAMKGAVAFQNTVLVHAANTAAWVRGKTETKNTLLHRDRAITMLREHLCNNPRDISDVAIISCLSAAALEDFDPRPGHKEISWVHMRAAREMIRARGGPAAFENTRLGMLINWQDYILSGYETHGPSFFFEHDPSVSAPPSERRLSQSHNLHSMPSPPYSTSSTLSDHGFCPEPTTTTVVTTHSPSSPTDEIRLQCEEFLDFLRRCEQLALYQRDNPTSSEPTRRTAVKETSLLVQILAAPPGARFTSSGNRKQMVARLTALMMLNAALWDYRYTTARASTFLQTLEQAAIDSEVSMSGSVEALLQILLACNDGFPEPWTTPSKPALPEHLPDYTQYSPTATAPSARPWFVGRMLKIAKRLHADSWHRVNHFLFSCFALQVQEPTSYLWEPELRREILDAPLTCYVMPSLME